MGLSTSFGVFSGIAATFRNTVPYHLLDRDGDLDRRGYEMRILAWWNQCRQLDRYNDEALVRLSEWQSTWIRSSLSYVFKSRR
jgi:hypothetical protein